MTVIAFTRRTLSNLLHNHTQRSRNCLTPRSAVAFFSIALLAFAGCSPDEGKVSTSPDIQQSGREENASSSAHSGVTIVSQKSTSASSKLTSPLNPKRPPVVEQIASNPSITKPRTTKTPDRSHVSAPPTSDTHTGPRPAATIVPATQDDQQERVLGKIKSPEGSAIALAPKGQDFETRLAAERNKFFQKSQDHFRKIKPNTGNLERHVFNEAGLSFGKKFYDGFKFTVPQTGGGLYWRFVVEPNPKRTLGSGWKDPKMSGWYILPVEGEMKGFSNADYQTVKVGAEKFSFTAQTLEEKHLVPGKTYIIWFQFDTKQPAGVVLELNLGKIPRGDWLALNKTIVEGRKQRVGTNPAQPMNDVARNESSGGQQSKSDPPISKNPIVPVPAAANSKSPAISNVSEQANKRGSLKTVGTLLSFSGLEIEWKGEVRATAVSEMYVVLLVLNEIGNGTKECHLLVYDRSTGKSLHRINVTPEHYRGDRPIAAANSLMRHRTHVTNRLSQLLCIKGDKLVLCLPGYQTSDRRSLFSGAACLVDLKSGKLLTLSVDSVFFKDERKSKGMHMAAFGHTAAITGDIVAISTPEYDRDSPSYNTGLGRVDLFRHSGGQRLGTLHPQQSDFGTSTDSDSKNEIHFGYELATNGKYLVVAVDRVSSVEPGVEARPSAVIYEVATRRRVGEIRIGANRVNVLGMICSGNTLAVHTTRTGQDNSKVILCNLPDGKIIKTIEEPMPDNVKTFGFSGSTLALFDKKSAPLGVKTISLYDVKTGTRKGQIALNIQGPLSMGDGFISINGSGNIGYAALFYDLRK